MSREDVWCASMAEDSKGRSVSGVCGRQRVA